MEALTNVLEKFLMPISTWAVSYTHLDVYKRQVGHKLSPKFKAEISLIFGVCSMGMGISTIGLMKNMPAVIFAIIIGTAIGLWLHLGDLINQGATLMQKPIAKILSLIHI